MGPNRFKECYQNAKIRHSKFLVQKIVSDLSKFARSMLGAFSSKFKAGICSFEIISTDIGMNFYLFDLTKKPVHQYGAFEIFFCR